MKHVLAFIFSVALLTSYAPRQAQGTTIQWSGYEWIVKSSPRPMGPGPNLWSDSPKSVWVDSRGRLHLKIRQENGQWYCAELYTRESLGYGKYLFYLDSRLDKLNTNVSVGLFVHASDTKEIDIEFSKWGENRRYPYQQYVLQPRVDGSNIQRTDYRDRNPLTAHGFLWSKAGVAFRSFVGHNLKGKKPFNHWDYVGPSNPKPSTEKVHINLWLYKGKPPTDGQETVLVLDRFVFQQRGRQAANR